MRPIPAPPAPRCPAARPPARLTDAHVLVVQLGGAVAVEAQAAVLAVLASRVVLAADTGHHVEEVDVAAAVGVAVALAVWAGGTEDTRLRGCRGPRPPAAPAPGMQGNWGTGRGRASPGAYRASGLVQGGLGKRWACQLWAGVQGGPVGSTCRVHQGEVLLAEMSGDARVVRNDSCGGGGNGHRTVHPGRAVPWFRVLVTVPPEAQ